MEDLVGEKFQEIRRRGRKMTETDKEKIDKALKEVEEVIKWWESGQAIYLHDNPQGRALMAHIDQIKKILES